MAKIKRREFQRFGAVGIAGIMPLKKSLLYDVLGKSKNNRKIAWSKYNAIQERSQELFHS